MMIFLMVAMAAFVISYALGLGGAVSAVIFLFVLFNGVLDRFAQPILKKIRS